ncbi:MULTISPECIES: GlsB/YeaQ/YmgE family stress response membrane protein [Kordiimonas]|jgi:uncharacterized membrane protein YeaQ/YmgE (transglycosylase-associated protein family)|uniref:Uncharacterized membrane protein YeaQ/YmgE, transglycosylase-associated protein family n=1 Tax=Kordiimonas lacus TaxID=637679 RepID=A0A1G6Y6H2_9PROT|nr:MULTISPECIES: GlsB/YeaQ/YmgE family stress response membrane protein [Kordiimonas]SDD86094.1 Uncharacterized membrane protein YeaQ/YmgE, transglycosylase-associated protein family [Kordiimonas lacus]
MIGTIITGAIVGFLAGHIIRGEGFGALGNIILGIFGGMVGNFLFGVIGLGPTGWIGDVIAGVAGALILVFAFGETRHRRQRRRR